MAHVSAGRNVGRVPAGVYERHRPKHTLLYRLIEEHYPTFAAEMAARERPLPAFVQREFEDTFAAAAWNIIIVEMGGI